MLEIWEYESVQIDLKEEYSKGYDLECHQNDNLIFNFLIRNYGEVVDISQFHIELRVKKSDGTDYIQGETGLTKGTDGTLKIICRDTLSDASGTAKGILRIWNKANNQKSTRIIKIQIKPDTLEIDRGLHQSTITIMEELNTSLNSAYEVQADFAVKIAEAKKIIDDLKSNTDLAKDTNDTLVNNTNLAKSTNDILVDNTANAENINNTLVKNTNIAIDKINTLNQININATENITNLTIQNDNAVTNSADLLNKNTEAVKNISDLITQNTEAVTNKSNLDKSNTDALNTINISNTTKEELDKSIDVAKDSIEIIKNLDTTNIIQEVADIKGEISTARGEYGNLDERITQAENSGGFYMAETLPEIVDRKPLILYKQILNIKDVG